jgi:glycerophosphoryl diester phosphodiesterase
MFEILFLFLHRRSQVRAGMTVYFQVFRIASPTRSTYAAPVLPGRFGLTSFFESCLCASLFTGCRGLWKSKNLESLPNPRVTGADLRDELPKKTSIAIITDVRDSFFISAPLFTGPLSSVADSANSGIIYPMRTPLIIAHRGDSSRALENSLEAFRSALSVPADMIEIDLRMSRDEVLFVMHDKHTGRTADRNIDIEQATAREISRIRLKNGEPIPALDDVLRLVAGKAGINVEIKSDGAGVVIARHLFHYRYSGYIMISSFKEAEVQSARGVMLDLPHALIYDTFSLRHIAEYTSKGYHIISLRKNTVTEPLVRACHARGLQLYVWTVDEEDEMKRCIEWGVDGIYSNKPAVLKEVVEKLQRASAK